MRPRRVQIIPSSSFPEPVKKPRPTSRRESITECFVATTPPPFLALGERRFDAAVRTTALMDMARIMLVLAVLRHLLHIHGRFVFSVTHPVFNSGDAHPIGERVVGTGTLRPRSRSR
jgi:hypothetical protein